MASPGSGDSATASFTLDGVSDIGSGQWYRRLVQHHSRRRLTVVDVRVFIPHTVTILVEEHDPELIEETEQLLVSTVAEHTPRGTKVEIVSLQTFEHDARAMGELIARAPRL